MRDIFTSVMSMPRADACTRWLVILLRVCWIVRPSTKCSELLYSNRAAQTTRRRSCGGASTGRGLLAAA